VKWVFSDGTTVHLGGKVQGTSALAQAIRMDVSWSKGGDRVPVRVHPNPAPPDTLDLDDPQLVDAWLTNWSVRTDVSITSAPEVEPFPEEPGTDDDAPGVIY
jgi:hypothetical protein